MGVIAATERDIAGSPEFCFARFIDFSCWHLWMPASFRPKPFLGPVRALRVGDDLRVSLGTSGRLTTRMRVSRVRENQEVAWQGGLRGVLEGEHSFRFGASQGQTKLRSEEPFKGLLSRGILGAIVERSAIETAAAILASFAAHIERQPVGERFARSVGSS